MPEFVLTVKDIDDDGKAYAFRMEPSWIEQALQGSELRSDPRAGAGSLRVHAQRSGADIVVQATVRTRVLAECSRCLGDAPIAVDTQLVSLMSRGEPPAEPIAEDEETELTADDLERDYYSGEHIVLDDLVRQHILLECPMQPLCDEACEGIAVPEHVRPPAERRTADGQRVDPRLQPLLDIARNLTDDEE